MDDLKFFDQDEFYKINDKVKVIHPLYKDVYNEIATIEQIFTFQNTKWYAILLTGFDSITNEPKTLQTNVRPFELEKIGAE
jgi:hypothetical protein